MSKICITDSRALYPEECASQNKYFCLNGPENLVESWSYIFSGKIIALQHES